MIGRTISLISLVGRAPGRTVSLISLVGRAPDLQASLGGSVGCAVRLETRRLRVQLPPRSTAFFRGD